MTTVVFKDGVFACDSQITCNDQIEGSVKKIRRIGKNYTVGWSGSLQACELLLDHLNGKEIDKTFFDKEGYGFDVIVADKSNRSVTVYSNGLIPEKYDADFYCIGSGSKIAKGALLMGATPKQAVEAAAKIDIYTGGKIHTAKAW